MPASDVDVAALIPTSERAIERGDVEWRRVGLFVAFAFGFSWVIGGIIYATGGIGSDSPELFAGIRLWYALSVVYMFGPAIGNVLTRLVTGEGRRGLFLRPRLRGNWRWWILAWLGPVVLIYLGGALFFALFPDAFDPTLSSLREVLQGIDQEIPFGAQELLLIQAVSALTINTAITCVATFGEEFGWRAYLLPKLLPLGSRRALVLSGVIWGVWHWPLILMGYNYPEAPLLGSVAMVYFAVILGVFLGWVALKGESVWPAVIGHAAINANAGVVLLLSQGEPSRLLGPAVTGVVGSLGLALLALWILSRADSLVAVSGQ